MSVQQFVESVDPSISSAAGFSSDQEDLRFVVVGKPLFQHGPLQTALRSFAAPVSYSETGTEHLDDADSDTVFIVEEFAGPVFETLRNEECRIIAPPVVIRAAVNNEVLPYSKRPIFCSIMEGLVICFSGLKKKEELNYFKAPVGLSFDVPPGIPSAPHSMKLSESSSRAVAYGLTWHLTFHLHPIPSDLVEDAHLACLVHHMGGSIRRDFSVSVTHLVSARSGGDKYRTAVGMGVQIMSVEWVLKCWECRDNPKVSATDDHLIKYKLRPFSYCTISFNGFSEEDLLHMTEVTVANGGICCEAGSPKYTHLVVNEHAVKSLSMTAHDRTHIVKSEWFWASIQMEACADESIYEFEPAGDASVGLYSNSCHKTPSVISSGGSRSHRRKRLRENLAQLAQEGETPVLKTRRSAFANTARRSLNVSALDNVAADSTIIDENRSDQCVISAALKDTTKLTPRQQTVMELFQTESNYVGILHTILKVFKEEIEKTDQPGGPILDPLESKTIFGGIPPIYEAHRRIREELLETVSSSTWLVGRIFLKHADALLKAYPSFVNYFEKAKEVIQRCDHTKPRFHAFLRVCHSKPECGRQSLTELLIRPVQRLPSILLLLRDILKRTDKSQPDFEDLNKAITTVEDVMKHINEDKRRTEGHQTLFGIINDIEDCPPNLLSAHRVFIQKVNATEVSDEINGKGTPLTLFVFTDSLEITKNRAKGQNGKSPGVHAAKSAQRRPYKHLCLLPFSSIKRIVDIVDTPECRDVFSLITKKLGDSEEKLLSFFISDETTKKAEFLTSLSKTVCTSQCRADYETLLAVVEAHVLNVDAGDLNGGTTFARAATKFGKRVSRVLSLNKTPQNTMKRATSSTAQMFTPSCRQDSVLSGSSTISSWGRNSADCTRLFLSSDVTESGDDGFDTDSYSGIVDLMSLCGGTPTIQRRHESVSRGQDTMSLGGNAAFSAPRMRPLSSRQNGYVAASTVQLRATANTLQSRDIRRDAAGSIQSLVAPCTLRKRDPESLPAQRPPSSSSCRPGETCI